MNRKAMSLVHLGDTSFRRREVIADCHEALDVLVAFRTDDRPWDGATQLEFFRLLQIQAPDIFGSARSVSDDDAAKRARTITNALVKLGFIDPVQRRPTALGVLFADGRPQLLDGFDRYCSLKPENSALLRGVLGYTEKTSDEGTLYFPVRLLLRVLDRLSTLSLDEFALAFIAGPRTLGIDVEAIVTAVADFRAGGQSLDDVLTAAERTAEQDRFIVVGEFNRAAFPNGKGPIFTERYRVFLDALADFRTHPDTATLAQLRRAVDEGGTTVKARFSPGTYLPGLKKKGSGPLTVHRGARYAGWSDTEFAFRHGLVDLFNGNRGASLVREYLDNNLRILTATGVISVAENQVCIGSAYARYFFAANADRLTLLTTDYSDAQRAAGLAEQFGRDALARANELIAAEQGIEPEQIEEFVAAQERARFDRIIAATFPPEQVLDHLRLIGDDHRSASVSSLRDKHFRGKASVPCMYEYLVGLSLYYSSRRAFDPRTAFGLSLDGDFLPISHAPGLRGDIEFKLDGRRILVEVTLMDPATQRRGELEPVLRHATNLACQYPDSPTVTIFIANEVDTNVARIFGFARVMSMTPTDGRAGSASPLIVSITTRDWVAAAAAPLDEILNLVAAEANRTEIEHLNSDWNAELVSSLRALASS
ncbi:MAG: AlwI family type II restriction endonuclease [Gordonia sp. (in: high G+C Gram-positive bacteria)]|uniref:AlwI family type II restriction endonuclease n=1 Tax=Gordonia sp. (in: high G+C Gram-positive bacteria) TaxID=84139 RepID=UPI003BB66664